MVKSSVLRRRSKLSPKKNQKTREAVNKRGRRKRNKSPRKCNRSRKDMINEFSSTSLNNQIEDINMANPGEDFLPSDNLESDKVSKCYDKDVINLLDDTVASIIDDSNLNESCFIIDVIPNTENEGEKSFYKYVDNRTDDDVPSSSHDKLTDESKIDSDDVSKGTKLISNDCSVNSIDDFNSSRDESLNDYEMNETLPISSVENQNHNNKLNNNSILNRINAQNISTLWSEYKKITEARMKNSKRLSRRIKTDQNSASRRIINKENLSDKNQINESVICIDNESDSDVEFIEAFNPNERLIELSDEDDSVVFEDVNVPLPLKIPIPKKKINNNKKKKSPKKNNNTDTNKADEQPSDENSDDDDDDDTQPAPLKRKNKKQIKRKKRMRTAKEEAMKKKSLSETHLLRPIVIDGCNVALGHSRVGKLSVEGLQICYDYFHSRGHDVKIFLPNNRKFHPATSNVRQLVEMERKGIVIFTPGRTVNGKGINSYDDRFILEYASLKGAVVISRDNYRDLYHEKEEFKETISKRLLQYTFVDDLIMFPDDPLGRNGPKLEEFLRFTPEELCKNASTSKQQQQQQ